MAELTCTNTKQAPAFKGTAVTVTLSAADALTFLPQLLPGQTAVVDSTTATCTVYSVDYYGHSFKVVPDRPEQWLGTGTFPDTAANTFNVNDSITVTT